MPLSCHSKLDIHEFAATEISKNACFSFFSKSKSGSLWHISFHSSWSIQGLKPPFSDATSKSLAFSHFTCGCENKQTAWSKGPWKNKWSQTQLKITFRNQLEIIAICPHTVSGLKVTVLQPRNFKEGIQHETSELGFIKRFHTHLFLSLQKDLGFLTFYRCYLSKTRASWRDN